MAAFTVYLDADEVKPLPKPQPLSRQPTLVDTLDSSEAGPSTVSATEKENLHPTGGRMTSSNALGAKRKSSVLVTKLHNPPNATKKRKLASSDSSESVSKSCKVKRSTTRTQKAPELPSVEEEVKDKDEKLARTLSQSQIDSRCYDLTVSPLANVSEAFGSPSPTSTPSKPQRVSKSVSKVSATPSRSLLLNASLTLRLDLLNLKSVIMLSPLRMSASLLHLQK